MYLGELDRCLFVVREPSYGTLGSWYASGEERGGEA
jgi:hypothetical protein